MALRRPRFAIVLLPALIVVLSACGGVQTAACSLFDYGVRIQADLQELLALDPDLVAQAGTPENAAALEAIASLEATGAEAQEALDGAADDVGPAIEAAFQAALDATAIGAANLRSAVESGDPATVAGAMSDVQTAANAIDAFMTALGDSRFECGDTTSPAATEQSSVSAEASASASASASVAPPSDTPTPAPTETASSTPTPSPTATPEPSPTPEPTPTPTPSPTPEPTPTPTPTPSPTATPTPSPTPSATPTASPTPSPTATSSPSPTASETPSPSPEPSPSASADAGDQGPGPLPWLAGLVLVAVAGGAIYVWYQNRNEPSDAVDVTDEGLPPEDQPPGGPPPPPPPTQG